MRVAVIASGDELMTGSVTDGNSAWISERLLEIGAETTLHLSVGDDLEATVDALRLAGERASQVIVTGGLGPTEDDLMRDAACRCAGVGLELNQPSLDRLRQIFAIIGRELTDNNLKQAHLPAGAGLIPNPIGTAPGFAIDMAGARYHFLPGVPRECRLMMEATVLPGLAAQGTGEVFGRIMLRTFGMTESQLDQDLKGVELPPGVKLGYRAVFPEIQLKLFARAATQDLAREALETAAARVRDRVGSIIFSDDGRGLEAVALDLLRERGMKIAVAESCTGGLIAKRLTDVAGSSEAFERGYVVYSNRAKVEMLGVDPLLIERFGAVSSETALAMAAGARERSGAGLALAVTGIAGPGGGSPERPVGTVHIALADGAGSWERKFLFLRAERSFIRELTAQAALEVARRRLLGLPDLER